MMDEERSTAGVILAAGMSVRLGKPKQLLSLNDKILTLWVVEAALASILDPVVLVLGYEAERILGVLGQAVNHPRLRVVINKRFQEGQAGSVRAGLEQVKNHSHSVMFLLGDQPLVGAHTIDSILDHFRASGKEICVPVCGGKRVNPAVFSRRMYDRILALQGDVGARNLIEAHPELTAVLDMDNPIRFMDVDEEQDIAEISRLMGQLPGI